MFSVGVVVAVLVLLPHGLDHEHHDALSARLLREGGRDGVRRAGVCAEE